MCALDVLRNDALDDDDVEPFAVELTVLFVGADLAEAAAATEREARGVEGKDPRHELPVAALAGGVDQRGEQQAADAAAARGSMEIDGELGDAGVARTRPVFAQTCPAHHRAVIVGNEQRK